MTGEKFALFAQDQAETARALRMCNARTGRCGQFSRCLRR